jgi:hypothetical protein
MFEMALADYLRSTLVHVVRRHDAHGAIAQQMARRSRWVRALEAVLMTAVAWTAVAAAIQPRPALMAASAAVAIVALLTLIIHLSFDFDGAARTHAECAAYLWRIGERYRTLLSDLSDGALPLEAVRRERDALIDEMHRLYDRHPDADQRAAAQGALQPGGAELTDEQIDRLLPPSLRKVGNSAA